MVKAKARSKGPKGKSTGSSKGMGNDKRGSTAPEKFKPKKVTKPTTKKKAVRVVQKTTNSTKQREHYPIIDFLKAFAAVLVVLIHVTSRYKGDTPLMFALWDYIHFAVGSFVLASGFLAANSYREITSTSEVWSYLKKKFKRVVVPYYEFAILFVLLSVIILDKEITKFINFDTILDTILLNGGVGNNWIPKLFFSLMLILLLDGLFSRRIKWLRYMFTAVAISGSIYLMSRSLDIPFVHSNLFGWSLILFTGYFLYKDHSTKVLLSLIALSGSLWFLLKSVYGYMGLDEGIFANKYPPDLYYVSYNVFAASIIWVFGTSLLPWISKFNVLSKLMAYLSAKSYEVFFLHLLVMEVWKTKIHWTIDTLLILFMTLCLVWVIDKVKSTTGRVLKGK